MNIFKKISFYSKIAYRFRPYFNNKEKYFEYFDIAINDIDKEIISLYEEIIKLGPKKYKKDKKKYENYVGKIDAHNKNVEFVFDVLKNYDYDLILLEPEKLSNKDKENYIKAREILKNYKKYPLKCKQFLESIDPVIDDYDELCFEHKIFLEYSNIFDFKFFGYIKQEDKRKILSKINEILSQLIKKEKYYYSFSKHEQLDELIFSHNDVYLENISKDYLFDNINGFSLDKEQRKSVLNEEDSVLVVAGAGSGKTLTICGKVTFLIKKIEEKPENILLLSYSKKSASDLQEKIYKINSKLNVGTFHKIGLDILKETQNKKFLVEDQYKAIIETYFREEIPNRPNIEKAILIYYGLYFNDLNHDKKYENEGELYENLKNSDFNTLKTQLLSLSNNSVKRETIKKELVKSFEEMAIANWYFINGIDYIYEAPYEFDVSTSEKRQYIPDFKLKNYKIYHEHYGIDKNGNASQFNGDEANKYVLGVEWKRKIHLIKKTDCIETYSYEFNNGTVFQKLEAELKKRGVQFRPLTENQILNALNSIYYNKAFKSFINLISTFLNLYKANYTDDKAFESLRNSHFKNNYEKNRASFFLEIVKDIYHYYIDYLNKEGKIDFDDMILQSIKALDSTQKFKFKYIIVDEFQDISISRMKFIKKLIEHGNSKLFAAGDDWQAIYRFSGCDLNIFLDFGKYFGDSSVTKITTTHRNSQELQDIAGTFIKKNKEQYVKNIYSDKHLEKPIKIVWYKEKKYNAFLKTLKIISRIDQNANVLILGRNNKDFEDIALDERVSIDYKSSNEIKTIVRSLLFPNMKLSYSTVHASKGLEEDYVILINADDARIGFPNKMEDDGLLDLVLSHQSKYEYAEERRLWYVALTRTKSYIFIIANLNNPSIFLKEIIDQCEVINPEFKSDKQNKEILCPHCKSGRLILRKNESNGSNFFGCSNYPYCDYTIKDMKALAMNKRCRKCGDFLVIRKGKWGFFLGCHNYPRCHYTEEYIPNKNKNSTKKSYLS